MPSWRLAAVNGVVAVVHVGYSGGQAGNAWQSSTPKRRVCRAFLMSLAVSRPPICK